jgi:hypothetical protein
MRIAIQQTMHRQPTRTSSAPVSKRIKLARDNTVNQNFSNTVNQNFSIMAGELQRFQRQVQVLANSNLYLIAANQNLTAGQSRLQMIQPRPPQTATMISTR